MNFYQTKKEKLSGSNYLETYKQAKVFFNKIKKQTKRKPYLRSIYFDKDKVFFDYFWIHLSHKRPRERHKRLKYFSCAIELIEKSRDKPTIRINPNNKNEILYRFYGVSKNKERFCIQIKENVRSKRKYLMSCFPYN